MKNKAVCVWRDVIHYFISRRLFVFCVIQFTILHYYGNSVKQFAIVVDYPAAPWILPFLGQNVYFQFVYGISVVYFYSNVPFLQRYEMYVLMRQGRKRWVCAKLLRIWISALLLATLTFVLSILPLVPQLEGTLGWGKLYQTLALTDTGAAYQGGLFFSYDMMKANAALTTVLLLVTVLWLVTGLMGTLLFALSVLAGRTAAMLAGTSLAVLAVVFANLCFWQAWIGFLSPFSWMDLLLMCGKVCRPAPSFALICAVTVVLGTILSVLTLKAVQTKDFDWNEEE